jgi:hypothetical protein
MADELAAKVGASIVSVDPGTLGCELNHAWTWQATADLGGEFVCVLEDDALPVDGFREQLAMVLAVTPAPIVSLYLGRRRPPQYQGRIRDALDRADESGADFIVAQDCLHAVGLVMRPDLVADFLANRRPGLPIDQAIGHWAKRRGHTIAHTVPSVVDHRDEPTLIAHPDGQPRTKGRVAWRAGTRTEWTGKSVEL